MTPSWTRSVAVLHMLHRNYSKVESRRSFQPFYTQCYDVVTRTAPIKLYTIINLCVIFVTFIVGSRIQDQIKMHEENVI